MVGLSCPSGRATTRSWCRSCARPKGLSRLAPCPSASCRSSARRAGSLAAMGAVSADQLLRLPVRVRGIDIGNAVDVLIDTDGWRALGLDVLCRDDTHRFLPLTAAALHPGEISVSSALTLLAEGELSFYRRRARSLRALRARPVLEGRRNVGVLDDIVVSPDGSIEELVGRNGRETTRLSAGRAVRIAADSSSISAA